VSEQSIPVPPIESVNFHFWQPCNMRCRYCFAHFRDVRADVLPEGHLTCKEAIRVVWRLAEAGFQKITFAGGEPLLSPWCLSLVRTAKRLGMTTSMVTNGSLLRDTLIEELSEHLDWIALSVDSLDTSTNGVIGRQTAGRAMTEERYLQLCELISRAGLSLKINTVVSRANWEEDMSSFILRVRPLRWKIMQVLPIAGQNERYVEPFLVDTAEFEKFVARHQHLGNAGIAIVPERNADMIGSYAMVDPAGRFYDNIDGRYTYSDPILDGGVHQALSQVRIDREKFLRRGGQYDW
jgi:radical S-adenosyl methionine domain-containing protein 2